MEKKVELEIRAAYGDLRKSEKKAADYVLGNLDRIKNMTLETIALDSGVSQPTVMRMIKAAGYDSMKSLKYALVEEAAKSEGGKCGQPFCGYPLSEQDQVKDIPLKITAAAGNVIEQALASISLREYEKIIEVLHTAEKIDIYGIENSSAACVDLSTKLLYLGLNARYVGDPYLQRIGADALTSRDAAIAISYSGASKDTVDAIKSAKERGATTIVLTNFQNSPISQYADYLLCSTQEQLFYGNTIFSRMSQILIVDMLYMGLIATDYPHYTERLSCNSTLIENKAYHI